MVQENTISFRLFASGYCHAPQRIVNPRTGKGISKFYAVWALIQHPAFGNMLFDCGYTPLFHEVTRHFPESLYALATPVFIRETETAKNILMQAGLYPEDINYIVLSHFHADHICGMRDFPTATFICDQLSLEELGRTKGLNALRKGILKSLLPADFESRVRTMQDISEEYIEAHSGLKFFKPFDQAEIQFVHLPGHAKGMLGMQINTPDIKILYCTDASWSKETFDKDIAPMSIVKLFFASWKDFIHTTASLKRFEKQFPEFTLLFTHCPHTLTHIRNHVL